MAAETLLIAAFSGRALAQSARRAGFAPLVVDCFGDVDMREAATAFRTVEASLQGGFDGKRLVTALSELSEQAKSKPIGLVLGAGFEGTPKLMATLASQFGLIGNPAAVVERAKDPDAFYGALRNLGIPYPETRTAPPRPATGWLSKRVGGSGGNHIAACGSEVRAGKRTYFQRKIPGEALSVLAITGPESTAFAFSRQWTAPSSRYPFRFGGAVGTAAIDEELEGRLIDISLAVTAQLELSGLISLDFLVEEGEPFLIEVNPRPGATLDIFDDGQGTLLLAHLEGCQKGGDPAAILASQWAPPIARAIAYLYADKGPVNIGAFEWPPWTLDRPRAGTTIPKEQPVVTVFADGASADKAEALCRERLGFLENMLYEQFRS